MKLWNYIIIFTTMMVFMEFLGLHTGLSSTLNSLGINIDKSSSELVSADIENSSFFSKIFGSEVGIFALLAGGGAIIVGLFAKSFDTSLVVLPLAIFIGGLFGSTFWSIILEAMSTGEGWLVAIIATIIIPLGVGFFIALVEWWRGTD